MDQAGNQPVVPTHLGIIPDGNRRWAKSHGFPSLEGHRKGLDVAKKIALEAFDRGVQYFTMYAFSTENWNRTQEEVGYLMDLFVTLLSREFRELEKREVRFRLIGSRDRLPKRLVKVIDETETRTAHFTRGTLALCLNYGGKPELVDAYRSMMKAGITAAEIDPEVVSRYLYAPDIPPVDLIVRTSGEQRSSGFMLWRSDYAEFSFVEKHWPDFTTADLDTALNDYSLRQRRFGK